MKKIQKDKRKKYFYQIFETEIRDREKNPEKKYSENFQKNKKYFQKTFSKSTQKMKR